jgi:hypothetical protein
MSTNPIDIVEIRLIAPNQNGSNGNNKPQRAPNGQLLPGHAKLSDKQGQRGASVGAAFKRLLSDVYDPGEKITRAKADVMAERMFEIVTTGRDCDAIKAAELFRKAVDGDKLTVADVESVEWSVDAEVASPVPPSLETNRLP